MSANNEEKDFRDVIQLLKKLPQVNAPSNFEADLKRRINREKYASKKKNFSSWFFSRTAMAGSAGLIAASLIIVFLFSFENSSESPLFDNVPHMSTAPLGAAGHEVYAAFEEKNKKEDFSPVTVEETEPVVPENDMSRHSVHREAEGLAGMMPATEDEFVEPVEIIIEIPTESEEVTSDEVKMEYVQKLQQQNTLNYRAMNRSVEEQKKIDSLRKRAFMVKSDSLSNLR